MAYLITEPKEWQVEEWGKKSSCRCRTEATKQQDQIDYVTQCSTLDFDFDFLPTINIPGLSDKLSHPSILFFSLISSCVQAPHTSGQPLHAMGMCQHQWQCNDESMTLAAAVQWWHVRQWQQHQCSHGMMGSNRMATQGVAARCSKTCSG